MALDVTDITVRRFNVTLENVAGLEVSLANVTLK